MYRSEYFIFLLSILLSWVFCQDEMYKVLIDCGSTGSRVYIYKFQSDSPIESFEELAHKRVRPALSTFYKNFTGLHEQLTTLITFAESQISLENRNKTKIALKATAGLRTLTQREQDWLINKSRAILRNSSFLFEPNETRVISGGEEALFGLIATNVAYSNISEGEVFKLAAADLGGSSQQITFMIPPKTFNPSSIISFDTFSWIWGDWKLFPRDCPPDYRIRFTNTSQEYEIFAKSIVKMGLVEAFVETSGELLNLYFSNSCSDFNTINDYCTNEMKDFKDVCSLHCYRNPSNIQSPILDYNSPISLYNPCVPPGGDFPYVEENSIIKWYGDGDFDACANLTTTYLLSRAKNEAKCLKKLKLPTIVAMDNFPRILEVMKLADDQYISPALIKETGRLICKRPWREVLAEFPEFMPYRAQQVCFGASLIYSVTKELYGLDENDSSTFLPTDYHKSFNIGWPLGAAIFSAMNWTYVAN